MVDVLLGDGVASMDLYTASGQASSARCEYAANHKDWTQDVG